MIYILIKYFGKYLPSLVVIKILNSENKIQGFSNGLMIFRLYKRSDVMTLKCVFNWCLLLPFEAEKMLQLSNSRVLSDKKCHLVGTLTI